MSERTARLDELLREEIAAIIGREIADPRIGFVTITERGGRRRTCATPPCGCRSSATRQTRRATLRALGRAMPFVRHRLGALRLKRIPELHVREDDTAERGTRVLRILDELEHGEPVDGGRRGRPGASCRCRRPSGASPSRAPEAPSVDRPPKRGPAAWRTEARRDALTLAHAGDLAAVPAEVVERLRAARRVLAIGHENPEADAFGSALGVALAVE